MQVTDSDADSDGDGDAAAVEAPAEAPSMEALLSGLGLEECVPILAKEKVTSLLTSMAVLTAGGPRRAAAL